MVQKDLAGKTLEAIEEVFADIVNCILFDGREVIKTDELRDAEPRSQYKADGMYHEQGRDVAKYWHKYGIRLAFVGIENETSQSRYMPLRMISYDGGAYRAQLPKKTGISKKLRKKDEKRSLYPVISLVLYFGTKRKWMKNRSLKEVLTIPPEFEPYVNDYRIHVVNVAFLERHQIDRFKSDFWFVADYFWQLRNKKEYKPNENSIKYAQQVLQMMSAMTGDKRFEKAYNKKDERQGGEKNMCEYLDKIVAEGKREGKREGKLEGERKGKREERENGIRVLVESGSELGADDNKISELIIGKYGLTAEQAMEKVEKYRPIPA